MALVCLSLKVIAPQIQWKFYVTYDYVTSDYVTWRFSVETLKACPLWTVVPPIDWPVIGADYKSMTTDI